MGTIQLNVEDKIIYNLGESKIRENFVNFLNTYITKDLLKNISNAIKTTNIDYNAEVENIKNESWNEYKKDIL